MFQVLDLPCILLSWVQTG